MLFAISQILPAAIGLVREAPRQIVSLPLSEAFSDGLLTKNFSPNRFVELCGAALIPTDLFLSPSSFKFFTGHCSLKSVQAILKSEQDLLQTEDVDPEPVPQKAHRFTRGAEYYRRGKK